MFSLKCNLKQKGLRIRSRVSSCAPWTSFISVICKLGRKANSQPPVNLQRPIPGQGPVTHAVTRTQSNPAAQEWAQQPGGMPCPGSGRIDFKTTEGESMSSPQAMPLQSVSTCQGSSGPCTDPWERGHGTPWPRLRMGPGRMEMGVKTGNHWAMSQPWFWRTSFQNPVTSCLSKSYCSNILVLAFQTYSIACQAIPHQSCI